MKLLDFEVAVFLKNLHLWNNNINKAKINFILRIYKNYKLFPKK